MNEDRPRPARRLLALLLALPLYAGCQGFDTPFSTASNDDDPLAPGGRIPEHVVPRPAPPQPVVATTGPNTQQNDPLKQPTGPTGQPTVGALASAPATGTKPGPAADDVRAKGPPGATDSEKGWRTTAASAASPGGAPLHGVEPIGDTAHPTGPGGSGVTPAGGVQRAETLEQAFDVLKKTYGMSWSKLTQLGNSDEYQFECSIPNRTAANMSQYYDGRGAGALAAVRNVLEKVMQEQGGN
jgi:hypothetical protein